MCVFVCVVVCYMCSCVSVLNDRVTLYVFCVLLPVSVCTCVVLNAFVCFVCALLCDVVCFFLRVFVFA